VNERPSHSISPLPTAQSEESSRAPLQWSGASVGGRPPASTHRESSALTSPSHCMVVDKFDRIFIPTELENEKLNCSFRTLLLDFPVVSESSHVSISLRGSHLFMDRRLAPSACHWRASCNGALAI
jgi:hypothetical protein